MMSKETLGATKTNNLPSKPREKSLAKNDSLARDQSYPIVFTTSPC